MLKHVTDQGVWKGSCSSLVRDLSRRGLEGVGENSSCLAVKKYDSLKLFSGLLLCLNFFKYLPAMKGWQLIGLGADPTNKLSILRTKGGLCSVLVATFFDRYWPGVV